MKRLLLTLLAATLAPVALAAQETPTPRPKIGLALGGGGAKGYAHIGVLKALEEMKIPVDYIAGTSMGAVVGALYASGMSADEVAAVAIEIDWTDALQDETEYPQLYWRRKYIARRYASSVEFGIKGRGLAMTSGFRTGQKLRFLLSRYLLPVATTHDFDGLPIPFRAVAADIETGEPVVLSHGDLPAAVRASMSIPGALTPVDYDGRLLVDGGIAMNLPVEVVRAMGADVVIAIDVGDPLVTREHLTSAVSIVSQLSTLLTRSNMDRQARLADLVLRPPVDGFQTADFDSHDDLIPRGIVEVEARYDELAKYAVSDAEYAAIVARQRNVPAPEIIIDAIEVSGENHVDERIIRRLVGSKVGTPLDIDRVEADIERIYGLGEFVGVSFGILTASGRHVLHIAVREKPWGPNYGRIGITMTATAPDELKVQLLGGMTNTRMNARGGEFRLDLVAGEQPLVSTEFIQPFDFDGLHFVSLTGTAGSREVERVVDGHPVALYEVDQQRLSAEYGVRFGSYGEARLGLMHRWTSARQTVGSPEWADIDGRDAGFHLSLGIDQLDNPFVPRNGAMAVLDAHYVLESLGSEYDYGRAAIATNYFKTWRRHTIMLGLDAGSWLGAPGPAHDGFVLGGFFGLSAYDSGHRTGNAAALGRIGYYAKVADVGAAFGRGVYVGAIVEAGNTFPSLSDATDKGTLWSAMPLVAVDSLLGPIYLGYAVGEDNEKNFYLTIGRTF